MYPDKDSFSIDYVLENASVSEKCSLLSGYNFLHTTPIPRFGIPSIRLSDGPNGIRGTRFFNGVPAACLPCGTALGATWDVELIRQAGELIGKEAKAKGVAIWLGPTINIQRSPLSGRGFESFAEDPVLSGELAAAIITGVESEGVSAVPKHFVCNDQEDHRRGLETIVTDRALREIYLKPFQIALAQGKYGAIMTAYNKVNGIPCSQNSDLLKVLREEWGFKGATISDWYGTYSTAEAAKAGLDLEMPGPTLWRGKLLEAAISSMTLSVDTIDERVRNVLRLMRKASKCKVSEEESVRNTPEDQKLLRRLSVESIVLLKNADAVLPWSMVDSIGVIGVHAKAAAYCGGGSAQLDPYYVITPIEGLRQYVESIEYRPGAYCHQIQPLLGPFIKRADGKPGVTVTFYNEPHTASNREMLESVDISDSSFQLLDYRPVNANETFYASMSGTIISENTAIWDFGVICHGTAVLYVNDELVVDNATQQRPGGSFFGSGTAEELGHFKLEHNETYIIRLEWGNGRTSKLARPGATTLSNGGARVGGCPQIDPQKAIEEAVSVACSQKHVVIFTGLNQEIESEGYDRQSMDLPGYSNELIDEVLDANPNTIVVIQSGTPVTMPWAHKAKVIIQAWYGGNELGSAIADVIFGKANPSGKLPMTFPKLLRDNPSYLNFNPDNARVLYGEDIFVGYRFYERMSKEPLFAFGHGLSYTTFGLSDLDISPNDVTIKVTNTGLRSGAEVIQLYISPVFPTTFRPLKELRSFVKVFLDPGETTSVTIKLDCSMTSIWCEIRQAWVAEKGEYEALVGTSSDSIVLTGRFVKEKTEIWRGLC
ncbi:beta-glucosidase-related glycosidase [Xylogone sp. PMI_703]|nr:beta-glucosidase-related glycosidase [Xylogone sp. PMI_703]